MRKIAAGMPIGRREDETGDEHGEARADEEQRRRAQRVLDGEREPRGGRRGDHDTCDADDYARVSLAWRRYVLTPSRAASRGRSSRQLATATPSAS